MELGPVRVIDPHSPFHQKVLLLTLQEGLIHAIQVISADTALYLIPGGVDVLTWTCWPQDPRGESLQSLAQRLLRAGYTEALVGSSIGWHDPDLMATLRAETLQAPIVLHLLATFWDNDQLAPVESLKAAGAWGWTLSPMAPIPWRALSEALPYLKALGGSIFLLPFWEAIAEEVGVPAQPLLALSGWRGTPEAAEVLAIRLLGEIHRLYGGNLHIGPLTTQKGLHAARAEGLPTFTALPYLLFSAERLLSYNPTWKFHPPLRSPGDQAALWKALGKGDIPLLASYHEAIPPEDKNHPWSEAAPGMPLLPQAASLFFSLAEQYGLPLEVAVTVWALQPRQYLGLPLPTLSVGQPLRHVLLRPLPEPKLWHDLQLSYELSPAVPSGA